MALNFPASPGLNDIHTDGNYKFQWDGDKWVSIGPEGVLDEIRSPAGTNSASITDATTGGSPQPAQFDVTFGSTNALQITTTEAEFNADVSCSNIKANTIKNASTNDGGIAIDSSGHVQIDGQQLPSAGALSNRNLVDNGAMQICQRATSVTGLTSGTANHGVDRFVAAFNTSGTWTIAQTEVDRSTETFESGLDPIDFRQSFKITCTSTATLATDSYAIIATFIEGQDLQHLLYGTSSAKTITLSFYVKSSKTGTASVGLRQYHGTSDPIDKQLYSTSYTIDNANTWEYKTITIPGNTADSFNNDTDVGFHLHWFLNSGSNFSTGSYSSWADNVNANRNVNNLGVGGDVNDYFQITGIQLEIGSVATPFEHKTFGDELARCQRYFEKSYDYDVAPGSANSAGHIILRKNAIYSSITDINFQFAVSKRTNPTVVVYSPETGAAGKLRNQTDSADVDASGSNIGTKGFRVNSNGIDANDLISAQYAADADF